MPPKTTQTITTTLSPYRNLLNKLPKGATSDHARQAVKIEEYARVVTEGSSAALMSLSGTTWNILNFGRSDKLNAYSNNPYNLEESYYGYVQRKKLQLDDILAQIKAQDESDPRYSKIDFMLLQEADFLCVTQQILAQLPEPYKTELKNKIKDFKKQLQSNGLNWKIRYPAVSLNIKGYRATIYNSDILDLSRENGLFPNQVGKNTGYETLFWHMPTRRYVAIVNLHFDTCHYSQQILDYQFFMRRQNILTILGGDTNKSQNIHAQGVEQFGLIGARDYATLIGGRDADGSFRTRTKVVTMHSNSMQYPKRYDGFFACPSSTDRRIVATELRGMFFSKSMVTRRVHINYLDPETKYPEQCLRQGKPCDNPHVHSNGHQLDIAFGWPYIPSRLKLFLVYLQQQNLLIVNKDGSPQVERCIKANPQLRKQAIDDFKDMNETYHEAINKVGKEDTLKLKEAHETLHRLRIIAAQRSEAQEIQKFKRTLINKVAEQKRLQDIKQAEAEGWQTIVSGRHRKNVVK